MYLEKINICNISDAEYLETEAYFKEFSEKIKPFKPEDRKRSLAGRLLLKKAVKKLYGKDCFTYTYNQNGKPICDFCYFSISHSGEYACIAVFDKPIGIDIQYNENFNKRESYKLFSKAETEFVNTKNSAERFFTIWTLKEAIIKADGKKLKDISAINLIDSNSELIKKYDGYNLTTEKFDNYILSVAEKS